MGRVALVVITGTTFFHTQLWFPASDRDFRRCESYFRCYYEVITEKNIVEEIESFMGARAGQSSPSWVWIPQKSLTIACDFWNTNSLGSPRSTGAHDGFSVSWHRIFKTSQCSSFEGQVSMISSIVVWSSDELTMMSGYKHSPVMSARWHAHFFVVKSSVFNSSPPSAAYMCQWIGSTLVQIMACHLFCAKPLSKPMLVYCQLDPYKQISVKFQSKYKSFRWRKCIWKYRFRNPGGMS